ncbi:MAG: hypothetical protein DRI97_04425 [Bacteroidetes bacterium]|nr:MAG: hypothetical protein DRI97_04425 [Bacteroidota bacterium]
MADLIVETGNGLTNSNGYVSLDDADIYHEMRLHVSDWTGASDDDKEAAIMWASRLLDILVNWDGSKVSSTQAMRWPRTSVVDTDGYSIASTEIPQFLADATAEYARTLISEDVTAVNALAGFKKMKVDVIELEVDKMDRSGALPENVWNFVKYYGSKYSSQSSVTERV